MRQKSSDHRVARATRNVAYRMVGLQAVTVIVIAGLWWIKGFVFGYSTLLGGAACILPNFYFARRLFSTVNPGAVKKILLTFYIGELIKLLASAVLLVLIIRWIPVAILACITGYVGAQLGFWLAPFFVKLDPIKSVG